MSRESVRHAAGSRRRAMPGRPRASALLRMPTEARPRRRSFRLALGCVIRAVRLLTRPLVYVWAGVAVVTIFAPPQYALRADVKFLFGVLLPTIDFALALVGAWGRDQ